MNQEIERQLEGLLIDAVMCGEIPFGNLLVRKDGEEFCYLGQGWSGMPFSGCILSQSPLPQVQ